MRPRPMLQRLDRQHDRHMAMPLLPRRPNRTPHESSAGTGQGLPSRINKPHTHDKELIVATTTPARGGAQYKKWVKMVLEHCEPVCIRCGYPVDMTLPRNSAQGASADHEPPLALTGDLTPGLDGSGIAHLQCNRQHGGKIGSARAQQKNKNNSQNQKGKEFLSRSSSTPADLFVPPLRGGRALGWPIMPRTVTLRRVFMRTGMRSLVWRLSPLAWLQGRLVRRPPLGSLVCLAWNCLPGSVTHLIEHWSMTPI